MSIVRTYSGPFLRGLGADPSTSDVFSSGYDPLAPLPEPVTIDVPYLNAPPYSGGYPSTAEPAAPSSSPGYNVADVSYPPSAGLPNIVATGVQSAINTVARPSPTVAVPLSPASLGLWFSGTSFGVPNWALLGIVVVVGGALIGGGRRR